MNAKTATSSRSVLEVDVAASNPVAPTIDSMDFHRFAAKMPNWFPPKNIIWSWFWSEFSVSIFIHAAGRYPMCILRDVGI